MSEVKNYVHSIDETVCYINYEKSPFKKAFILDDIEKGFNENNEPVLYVQLKNNNPQMHYVIAEIQDFDIIAPELSKEDQSQLLKIVFDKQIFAKEFNALYTKTKTDEIADKYLEKMENLQSQASSKENALEAFRLGLEFGEELKSIPTFLEPQTTQDLLNPESCN